MHTLIIPKKRVITTLIPHLRQIYLFCASLSKNVKYRAAAAPIITTKEMMISVPMILNIILPTANIIRKSGRQNQSSNDILGYLKTETSPM